MYSDSGVVTRTWGGRRVASRRSRAVVSPVRTAVRISGAAYPSSTASALISPSGSSRFRRTSFDSALRGDT